MQVCKQCGRPIQVIPGHRPRSYCSSACKQLAYRHNQIEKRRENIRQHWRAFSPFAQERLETLMRAYGEDAAQLATDALTHL
jgi:hypothetical protein